MSATSTGLGYATSSQAYPTANKAYLVPFTVPESVIAYKLGWVNGTSPTGNADVGIYDAAGTMIVSGGGTARSGSGLSQAVDITDTVLAPDTLYYLAYAQDDTSAVRVISAPTTQGSGMLGVREKATSYVLPATLTGTSAPATTYVVLCFVEARARA